MAINWIAVKKVFGAGVLLISAITAASEVFEKDRKEKEFEAMKKDIAELKSKKD